MNARRAVYNFSSGPTMMPLPVLKRARRELLNWQGTGMSVMEMPFTGPHFKQILESARRKLRCLLNVPEGYHLLFMHGGASTQFSLLPINLLGTGQQATYINSGYWSEKAAAEANLHGPVHMGASLVQDPCIRIPATEQWSVPANSAYCHITSNETAQGIAFADDPQLPAVPLVADMTSDFMTRPVSIGNYELIYAGAQKNIGPSGLTIVILKDSLLDRVQQKIPKIFSYREQVFNNNLINTPLTYAIYLTDLVCDWVSEEGGLDSLWQRNRQRTQKIYALLDRSSLYRNHVHQANRSLTNLCFHLPSAELEQKFIQSAACQGLLNLQGHSRYGGIRISLYNAHDSAATDALTLFLEQFDAEHRHKP